MLVFEDPVLERIVTGDISLAFRRWERPLVEAGHRVETRVGPIAIDAVGVVTGDDVTGEDARRAGYSSAAELLEALGDRNQGTLYRIELHFDGG